MSLNYDLSTIKDWEKVTKHPDRAELTPVTHALIWATIAVGSGHITELNAYQFYRRLSFSERARGSYLQKWDGEASSERYITIAEVRAHVGLSTNADTMTDAQFLKKVWGGYHP